MDAFNYGLKVFVIFFIVSSLPSDRCCGFDNWPQWRGQDQNSLSRETDLPDALNKSNLLWRVDLPGPGGVAWSVAFGQMTCGSGVGSVLVCFSLGGCFVVPV